MESLVRNGEIINIIAPPKVGKSHVIDGLLTAVAMGRKWLGTFQCAKGKALKIDNELHPETISHRLRVIGAANNCLGEPDFQDNIEVIWMRDPSRRRHMDIFKFEKLARQIPRGKYKIVIFDALYRMFPPKFDENDNGSMALLWDHLDHYASIMDTSIVIVHHASKGAQTGKATTDMGSGGGAQSRATDTHLVLLPHKEPGAVVVRGALRSFVPLDPFCLRFDYPVFNPAPDLDPEEVYSDRPDKGNKGGGVQKPGFGGNSQQPGRKLKSVEWTWERFARCAFPDNKERSFKDIFPMMQVHGLGEKLVRTMLKETFTEYLICEERGDDQTRFYRPKQGT